LVLGWKEFNGTHRFCSLPQGEREEGRWKDLNNAPLTLALSREVERGLAKGEKG
jgi:hypothetical protein